MRRIRLRGGGLRSGIAAVVVLALGVTAQQGVETLASWVDSEWVSAAPAAIGTVDCADHAGAFASRGEGQLLSGSLLGIALDDILDLSGMTVTNDGMREQEHPVPAAELGDDAFANPLSVELLQLAAVNLGRLLQFPLATDTGVVGQYARATKTAIAVGASGAVTDSGGLDLGIDGGSGIPDLATLDLSTLLTQLGGDLGSSTASVANLSLTTGAVVGRATLDGCAEAWGMAHALERDYLTSHLGLDFESPTVRALNTAVHDHVTGLQGQVNALVNGAVGGLTAGVTGLLNGVLAESSNPSILRLKGGGATVEVEATINTSTLFAHLATPIADEDGILNIDLQKGTVSIDIAALVGQAFHDNPGLGLNALPPNSEPLADSRVLSTLSGVLTQAVGDWLADLGGLLSAAVDAIQLKVVVGARVQANVILLGWTDVIEVGAVIEGSLKEVSEGDAEVSANVGLLPGLPILGQVLSTLLNGLLTPLTNVLLGDVVGLVGTTLNTALSGLRVVPAAVNTAAAAVSPMVSGLYGNLLQNKLLTLTVNAQNDPLSGGAEPGDWGGLPEGRYDVAALRIGLAELLGSGVHLYLGRGSVGVTCSIAQAAQLCPDY